MAFICTECRHIFDDGEEQRWTEPHGERISGCPVCGGAYVEAVQCKGCRGEHLEDDLVNGWCGECLKERITFDAFWTYLKDREYVADFMFGYLWSMEVPEKISDDMLMTLELIYKALAAYEQRFKLDNFMQLCEKFVMADYWARFDFADWLNGKGVK